MAVHLVSVWIGQRAPAKRQIRGIQIVLAVRIRPAPQAGAMVEVKGSGSNGGVGLLVRLPIPGKQVGDFVGGVIWKPGQHVSEPGLRIDVVHLAGFDQGIDGGGSMAASV